MNLLVDSHALIWWWDCDAKLTPTAHAALENRANAVFVSAATAWEIATKVRAGRLPTMRDRVAAFDENVIDDGFHHLEATYKHGVAGGLLPGAHGDPFDRLIAAQALIEDLTVVTRDREIAAFGCKVLW